MARELVGLLAEAVIVWVSRRPSVLIAEAILVVAVIVLLALSSLAIVQLIEAL